MVAAFINMLAKCCENKLHVKVSDNVQFYSDLYFCLVALLGGLIDLLIGLFVFLSNSCTLKFRTNSV